MFFIELAVVLLCILIGARVGGIGLGALGGLGLMALTFIFGLQPTSPPIDVMLMIMAVVAAAACLQAAGGLDYLIGIAEAILRKKPQHITFVAPIVTYFFTVFAGTGHVAYSVLPVIAEVARRTGIRPERPLGIAVIASQFAIVASPISAAVVAMVGYVEPSGITLGTLLLVTMPATFLGVMLAAAVCNRLGVELKDDPEYQRRLADPEFRKMLEAGSTSTGSDKLTSASSTAKLSVLLFLFGAVAVVILGAFPAMRPSFLVGEKMVTMGMAHTIEIVMLGVSACIILACKPNADVISRGSVFHAGMRAVIAIFGIAWLGDTLFASHMTMLKESVQGLVNSAPWAFAFALFLFSVMVNSQGATTTVLMPLGIGLGLPATSLVAMFPAVNGYFFVPNYGPIIAAIDFDQTGTTRIGRFVFNHSFMLPGLLSMALAVPLGFFFAGIFL